MKQRKWPVAGGIAVGVVSALLTSVWFAGPPVGASANLENRELVQLPELTTENLLDADTYAQIEAYAKDNVRLKPVVVEAVNDLLQKTTGETGSSRVLYGARLNFQRPRELFSAAEFTNRCWEMPEISVFREALIKLETAAEAGDKDLVIIITPSKYRTLGYLLGPRLDDLAACAALEDAVIAQLSAEFPDLLQVVDPQRVIHYSARDPYWAGDTHWTPKGGRAFSELVVRRIASVTPRYAEGLLSNRLQVGDEKAVGGLYKLEGLNKTTRSPLLIVRPQFKVSTTRPAVPGADKLTFKWVSSKPLKQSVKSMLIIHDSFVNVPNLTRQFSHAVSTGYDVHWKSIADLNLLPPVETVVVENVDRTFLHRLVHLDTLEDLEGQSSAMDTLAEYLRALS